MVMIFIVPGPDGAGRRDARDARSARATAVEAPNRRGAAPGPMCSVVILRRPGGRWPLILGANRDEMADRPWRPPGRHWPDRPHVVAGMDELAGGSWLGINDDGVVAGVLNRKGSLGPAPGLRSRGELVLEALDHGDAVAAAEALAALDPRAYRSFNLVVADDRDAFWLRSLGPDGPPRVEVREIPAGVHMVTAYDLDDRSSPRIRRYLDRFRAARTPDPDGGDWRDWERLLASRIGAAGENDEGALCVATEFGFETVSSSLIALPGVDGRSRLPVWRFAAGRPDRTPFEDVPLLPDGDRAANC